MESIDIRNSGSRLYGRRPVARAADSQTREGRGYQPWSESGMSKFETENENHGDELSDASSKAYEEQLLRAIRHIRYGSVEVIIHDGRPVQIERKEKLRLDL